MYRKFIAVALLLAGFWCLGQQEGRSQFIGDGVWKKAGAAASNNTAFDGAVNVSSTCPETTPGLTTSAAGIVVVFVEINGSSAGMTVVGGTLGSFTLRVNNTSGANPISEWFAISSGAVVSEFITITAPASIGGFCESTAFGVKGVLTGTNNGYDANGALPNSVASGNLSITTSNANDFLLSAFRGGATAPSGGWAQVTASASFLSVNWLKVTSTQPSLVVVDPVSNNGAIGDALVSN